MKLRPFEIALIAIFTGLAIFALILLTVLDFSSGGDNAGGTAIGPVEIWGTLPSEPIQTVLTQLREQDERYLQVTYRYLPPETFDESLVTALADGVGPDLLLTSHENLVDQRRRLQPVSYESFPLRDFTSMYLDGASVFTLSDGIYAFPIMVDPLMLFYNRSVLANEGFLAAPQTWEELVSVQFPALIERGFDRTISRSVVAMGVYGNTRNAFGTLSMLMIQAGSDRVVEADGVYSVRLNTAASGTAEPFRTAVDFFMRFAQPTNTLYSWNRSFSDDRTQFISEDLIFYFGYGSEGRVIEQLNPNLSFDIAEVPQGAGATVRRTYGRFYGLTPLRSADNLNGAFQVMSALGAEPVAAALAANYNMVPAHRAAVARGSNDSFGRFTYRVAPVTYGWLNPNLGTTNDIFTDMTRSISENRNDVTTATLDALNRLRSEY
jgi:ABC-type glycerol-3-phosphate transport system substrate-binding protein